MTRDVRILNTGSLLELQRRLRAAGGENIRSSMQRRIRRAAEPLRDDLQDTMRNMPLRSQGRSTRPGGPSMNSRPLRETLAAAIRISVRTTGAVGATVWVDRGRLPKGYENIPNQINQTGRLRHPVFGNKRRWVNQWGTALWWDNTVRSHRSRMDSEVSRVLDDVRRRLE